MYKFVVVIGDFVFAWDLVRSLTLILVKLFLLLTFRECGDIPKLVYVALINN